MIVVWGKVAGFALGVFGGAVGAAFGLLVGHLLDVVAAEFLLRSAMLRVLTPNQRPRLRQFNTRVGLTALVAAYAGPVDWRVSGPEAAAFSAGVGDWWVAAPRIMAMPWIRARTLPRYLHVAAAVRSRIDETTLAKAVLAGFARDERQTVIGVSLSTLQMHSTGRTVSRLRAFARVIEIADEWIERSLPRPPLDETTTVLHADDCAVLGVPPDAGLAEVKRVYRNLAAQFHPDTLSCLTEDQRRQSAEAFVRITAAYERVVRVLGSSET